MAFTPQALRRALGRFATGVTIMSIRDNTGAAFGVTVNSFVSVSLEPPLILWCLRRKASIHEVFQNNDLFAVNILNGEGEELSNRYAASGRIHLDKAGFTLSRRGIALMTPMLANLECQILRRDDGGDHTIILARVLDIHGGPGKDPLIFYEGGYRQLENSMSREIA